MLRGVVLDGSRVVVRHARRGGLVGRIIPDTFFGRCRPFRELLVAEKARNIGIPTAEVVAAVRRGALGPFYRGDVYTKEVTGAVDLLNYLTSMAQHADRCSLRAKRDTLREAGRIVRVAHDAGLFHADLQLKNILARDDGKPAIFLIDLDKAKWHKRLPHSLRMMNLIRLARSAAKAARSGVSISRTDMLRFLIGYIGPDEPRKLRVYWRARLLKPVFKVKWALSDALYRLAGSSP
jgi:3-deoxy-D-manno-octulosonic acid kinase